MFLHRKKRKGKGTQIVVRFKRDPLPYWLFDQCNCFPLSPQTHHTHPSPLYWPSWMAATIFFKERDLSGDGLPCLILPTEHVENWLRYLPAKSILKAIPANDTTHTYGSCRLSACHSPEPQAIWASTGTDDDAHVHLVGQTHPSSKH